MKQPERKNDSIYRATFKLASFLLTLTNYLRGVNTGVGLGSGERAALQLTHPVLGSY